VFVSLALCHAINELSKERHETYAYKQATPKETAPQIFGIVNMMCIQKNGPLISTDQQFTASKVFFGPVYKEMIK
jgi:hypothetical protein